MPSTINQYQYKINSQKSNIDVQYGIYTDLPTAKEQLLDGGLANNLLFDNGYTFAVYETGEPIEYQFHGITENTTVSQVYQNFDSYVKRKVNDTKVVLKKADGTVIGQFTLNQAANGDIEITIPGDEQVQANWIETDTSAKSFIKNKPDLTNVVYFGDVNN